MAQMISYVLGAAFVVIGLLGFFNDPVIGLFEVDMVHNIVHLVTGLILLAVGYAGEDTARMGALVVGVVYGLIAVIGLVVPGEMLLGIMEVNLADDVLHVVLAAVLLYAGLMTGGGAPAGGGQRPQGGGGQPREHQQDVGA